MPKTPFINIWNPICKKYQYLRILNIFTYSDTCKLYKNDSKIYTVVMNENNQCKCACEGKGNKYLVVTDSQVFRYLDPYLPNNWINKTKIFPNPNLGIKNIYTNKYSDIEMIDLYNFAKERYSRYIKFEKPTECCNKN
jgi:hypothetical protein